MSRLGRLEQRLAPFAIHNLTLYLVIGQTFVYLTGMLGMLDVTKLVYVPALVAQGEWWRPLTFIFVPPNAHWAFIAFALYFLYFMGSSLEGYWGALRYNLFLLTGYLLTVGVAVLTPFAVASNVFIGGAIFLAFAYLNPDFQLYIFFILPVRIKWLALIAWVGYALAFFAGGLAAKLGVLAAVGNFLLFFGRSIVMNLRTARRHMSGQRRRFVEQVSDSEGPRHRCWVCGKNSDTHPQLDFRYCSKCAGEQCYCPDHIRDHTHVLVEEAPKR